ncbi:MAG: cupredoxin domain-containing protein [Actinomycetota bacterium]
MSHPFRTVAAAGLAVGGLLHGVLYVDAAYDDVPQAIVRLGFPAQALASIVVAVALLVDASRRSALAAIAVSGGSLLAFGASRTVGLLGFRESGFEPIPETPMLLAAEAVALVAATVLAVAPAARIARVDQVRASVGAALATAAVVTLAVVDAPESASSSAAAADGGVVVDIDGFAFGDGTIEVDAGTPLVVVNRDAAAHTVDAVDGGFRSGSLSRGDVYEIELDAGTFEIFCAIHPSMTATVVVG